MKIGIGIPEQIIGFDAGVLRDYAVTAEALGFDYLTCVDHVLGTTHDRREPPFPPGGISTQERLDRPRCPSGRRRWPRRRPRWRCCRAIGCGSLWALGGTTSSTRAWGTDFKGRGRRQEEQELLLRRLWQSRSSTSNRVAPHRPGEHQPRLDRPVPIWFGSRRMKASTCSYHHGQEVLA